MFALQIFLLKSNCPQLGLKKKKSQGFKINSLGRSGMGSGTVGMLRSFRAEGKILTKPIKSWLVEIAVVFNTVILESSL